MESPLQAVEIYKKQVRVASAGMDRALRVRGQADLQRAAHQYAMAVARWRRAVLVAQRATLIPAAPARAVLASRRVA